MIIQPAISAYGSMGSYTGGWHQYAMTYDGAGNETNIKLYVDGDLIVTTNTSTGAYVRMRNKNAPFDVFSAAELGLHYDGYWKKLQFYRRELSADEVKFFYEDEIE